MGSSVPRVCSLVLQGSHVLQECHFKAVRGQKAKEMVVHVFSKFIQYEIISNLFDSLVFCHHV